MRAWTAFCLIVCVISSAQAVEPFAWVGDFWDSGIEASPESPAGTCRLLTREGWRDDAGAGIDIREGRVGLTTVRAGLHVLRVGEREQRMLALAPPPPMDARALRRALPRQADRLLAGEPITLVALGDSVTATGDFPRMLAMLLARATGNARITVHVLAHPGRSVDATVRTLDRQVLPLRPDIALLMYGLNDQGAGTSLHVYLEQTRWIARRLADDCGTDTVLLEPTPHIADAASAFRVIAFAAALRDLGASMNVPVAHTFDAIWGSGGADVDDAMARMKPLFPPHYSKRWQTLLEGTTAGDTIHPNALGHLALAQCIYDTLMGRVPAAALRYAARHEWTPDGMVTRVTVHAESGRPWRGTLVFFSASDYQSPLSSQAIDLAAGASSELAVPWPAVRQPTDLLAIPAFAARESMRPMMAILEQGEASSHVSAVEPLAAVAPAFVASCIVANGTELDLPMTHGLTHRVSLPVEADLGAMTLQQDVRGQTVVGRLWFVRMAGALPREAVVDGDLGEWTEDRWNPLGDPLQASWTSGPDDKRTTRQECDPWFALRAGELGLYVAFRVQGMAMKDRFVIYFDPRSADDLGSVGPYYWCDGSFDKQGRFRVSRGETSPDTRDLKGAWQGDENSSAFEVFVPWAILRQSAWPAGGDLGLSISWQHHGPGGITRMAWTERGHPWNTLGYGVARRVGAEALDQPLPRMVFVRP